MTKKLSILILCFFGLAARLVFLYLEDPRQFPVSTVKISASYEHVMREQLEHILEIHLSRGFFGFDQAELYKALKVLDWVDQVEIERIWPDQVNIVLSEKIPVVFWNNQLMTAKGVIFDANENEKKQLSLPHLFGPEQQRIDVLHNYEKLSKLLEQHGLSIVKMSLSPNQSWTLTLDHGIVLRLGKKEIFLRAERFCRAYPAVFLEKLTQVVSVDLRYERGMAVQWNSLVEKK